jgi:GTP1/Obg family GTP-binding protein
MSDIVERLRQAEQMAEGRGSSLFKEAADYIEQLQGALQEMRDLAGMSDVGASIISSIRLVRD